MQDASVEMKFYEKRAKNQHVLSQSFVQHENACSVKMSKYYDDNTLILKKHQIHSEQSNPTCSKNNQMQHILIDHINEPLKDVLAEIKIC